MEYVIEASMDGKIWSAQSRFKKGQDSRFGVPFDEIIAIKEAHMFKANKHDYGWKYVRVIINI